MGDHNSLSVYTDIILRLHRDIAERYPEDTTDHKRDAQEIRERTRAEGVSFLTKTLPSIGKAVDKALCGGKLELPYLAKRKGTELPNFLGALFSRVFDKNSAEALRENVDVSALRDLRTLAYLFYKLELPYAKETEQSVLDAFIQTEEEMANHQIPSECDPIVEYASHLVGRVFDGLSVRDIRPRHGPGAVATGEVGAEKFSFRRRFRSLEWYYPFREYFFVSDNHYRDHAHWVKTTEEPCNGTAKVVLVPKDSRGPRLISCEPLEIQWIQQGLLLEMTKAIESHPFTRGHVNFTCQEINRQLALRASAPHKEETTWVLRWNVSSVDPITQMTRVGEKYHTVHSQNGWVTLDMKDASDRVSLKLVERLFQWSSILGPLKASRSTSTVLPDKRTVSLAKFAPMGSAVCFPVEAMCFWALSVASLVHVLGIPFRKARHLVYVYGDDLIVDREIYPVVMRYLTLVGLKFNESKCCVSGLFRESCGCDAYNGVDVTPARLRKTWSHRGDQDAGQLVGYVAFSNAMYSRGYWRVSDYVRALVENLYGPLPNVSYMVSKDQDMPSPENLFAKSRVIGFYSPHERDGYRSSQINRRKTRFNREFHRSEIYGPIVEPVYEKYPVNGWNELLRQFVGAKRAKPGVYAVPHRSRLKRGWGIL